jgi:hypothetical protein
VPEPRGGAGDDDEAAETHAVDMRSVRRRLSNAEPGISSGISSGIGSGIESADRRQRVVAPLPYTAGGSEAFSERAPDRAPEPEPVSGESSAAQDGDPTDATFFEPAAMASTEPQTPSDGGSTTASIIADLLRHGNRSLLR